MGRPMIGRFRMSPAEVAYRSQVEMNGRLDVGEKMSSLLNRLSELGELKGRFLELDPDDVIALSDAAVQIELRGKTYWLPYSQLRDHEGQLYASKWILDQKGIEV